MFAWNWLWPELRHRLNKSINGHYLFIWFVLEGPEMEIICLFDLYLKVLRWRLWTQVKDWFTVQAATFPWNVSTGSFAFPNIIFTSHFLLHWNVCKVKISYLSMKCLYRYFHFSSDFLLLLHQNVGKMQINFLFILYERYHHIFLIVSPTLFWFINFCTLYVLNVMYQMCPWVNLNLLLWGYTF